VASGGGQAVGYACEAGVVDGSAGPPTRRARPPVGSGASARRDRRKIAGTSLAFLRAEMPWPWPATAPTAAELWRVGVAWPLGGALRHAALAFGAREMARSPDRRVLEEVILAHYAACPAPLRLLFVGTRRYTRGYERRLAGHRLLTLDIDPRAARYGSPHGHVVACASRAVEHYAPGSFDVVLCNGVFGWGLDRRADVEDALDGFATLLRPHGELVIGWNDVFAHRPFPLAEARALARFEPFVFPPLNTVALQLHGASRHRFEFFRRRPVLLP
jgi:SAM-dependent methyltransferase